MKHFDQITVVELISRGRTCLLKAGVENAQTEAEILLAFSMGITFRGLLGQLREPVPQPTREQYEKLVKKRCEGQPLQYLTGTQEFMSLEFEVNESVLVPRWDTERLVELVLRELPRFTAPVVVDVGTGSGAIAVSLAKYYVQGKFFAVDISSGALDVAKRNAGRHGVEERITFLKSNLLETFLNPEGYGETEFDIIVSNPPYIARGEIPLLPLDVQKEPHLALDGGKDGLSCYRELLPQARQVLRPGGYVFLEIGCTQGEAVCQLCRFHGFSDVTIFRDYGNRDRVVSGQLKR